MTIHVAWDGSSIHRCPQCGHQCRILAYETRLFRYVDQMRSRCFVHVEVPKHDCNHCGKTPKHRIPLAKPNVSYARFFAMEVIRRLREDTVAVVSKSLKTSLNIVDSIFHARAVGVL